MMKKIFFCMALGATLLSSCSSDEPVITTDGGNVTFRATLPAGIMSRSAYDDGLTASNLEYAVYDATGANIVGLNGSATLVDRTATIGLNLVTGKTYTVVFWAAADGAPYTFDATEGKMTVTPAGDANDTKRDAFFASETFTVTGAVSKTIELRRPFAQINIGTSDLDDFTNAGGKISKSGITVTAAETLNLIDGTVEGEVEYVLAPAAHVTDVEYTVPSADKQQLLTTNFVLVDRAKSTLDITWTSDNDTPGRTEVVYTHVPVQRNYRTNIYGKLLTNPTSYEVVINPEFEDGDLNSDQDIDLPEIAPGVYNNVATKTYIVTTTEGFKWFAENKTLGKKETFQLGGNIDLGGEPITPIKTEWQSNAVVDGNGFTISNIKFDAAHAALFQGTTNSGSGWVGSFKNINVDGITGTVNARFCGLVGNLYGNMENVHVKNVVINSAEGRVGALVGIHNSGVLKNCSIENVEINGWWSVGGMIGGINETKNRVYENLTIKNVKVSNTYDGGGYHSRTVGVLVGDINISGISFTGCTIEDCDTDMPQYYIQNTFTWNGVVMEEQEYED